jgi:glutamate-1-semialdehyde 2,1-aminomutase
MARWEQLDHDRALHARWVASWLPERIFDAHAHLYHRRHYAPQPEPWYLDDGVDAYGYAEYLRTIEWLHPGQRTRGGLFFGLAFLGDRAGNNAFVAAELAAARAAGAPAYGALLVSPDDDAEHVRARVRREGWRGLKCYHVMARVAGPTFHAPIEAYLPEPLVAVAHDERLTITLHMVRDRALADPVNQATIQRYCRAYPNMRFILAHAARGFNPWHTIEGIHSLAGLENVYFDTSAVTEAGAFEAIIETMGVERLLYGTDYPVSQIRGRCVAFGDSFHWLYADHMDLHEKHVGLEPVLIGLESLRSLGLAFQRLRLGAPEIAAIFWGNAARLFAIAEE